MRLERAHFSAEIIERVAVSLWQAECRWTGEGVRDLRPMEEFLAQPGWLQAKWKFLAEAALSCASDKIARSGRLPGWVEAPNERQVTDG